MISLDINLSKKIENLFLENRINKLRHNKNNVKQLILNFYLTIQRKIFATKS